MIVRDLGHIPRNSSSSYYDISSLSQSDIDDLPSYIDGIFYWYGTGDYEGNGPEEGLQNAPLGPTWKSLYIVSKNCTKEYIDKSIGELIELALMDFPEPEEFGDEQLVDWLNDIS